MMTGNEGSTHVESRLKNVEAELDSYLNKVGLGGLIYDPDIDRCLALTQAQLSGMTAEECGEKAYTLAQYSLYLQKETNRQTLISNWAEKNIGTIVAKEGNNYGNEYTKYEVRKELVVLENGYANALNEVLKRSKAKAEQLSFLARNVTYIGQTLLELQQTKRGVRWKKD